MSSEEQAVLAAIAAVPSHRTESGMVADWPEGESWETWTVLGSQPALICEALGLDPDMPLSRLREDLAVAARVRRCDFDAEFGCIVVGDGGREWTTAGDLLAFLRGDAT